MATSSRANPTAAPATRQAANTHEVELDHHAGALADPGLCGAEAVNAVRPTVEACSSGEMHVTFDPLEVEACSSGEMHVTFDPLEVEPREWRPRPRFTGVLRPPERPHGVVGTSTRGRVDLAGVARRRGA